MEQGKNTTKKTNNGNSNDKALEAISLQLSALLEMNKKQQEETSLLKQEIAEMKKKQETRASVVEAHEAVEPVEEVKTPTFAAEDFNADRMVEIVHLAERAPGITTTLLLADGRQLVFRKYGDSVRVRYFEFQQLISTYYDLFYTQRIFTLGKRDQDIALAERLPTFDEKCLTKEEIRSLLALTPKQLEEVYNRVCDTHKELSLSTWQRGYFTNADPEYSNLDKVNALNKVSGNKLRPVYDNIVSPIVRN